MITSQFANIEAVTLHKPPTTIPIIALFLLLPLRYKIEAGKTNKSPVIRSAHSPTQKVDEKGSFISIFTTTVNTPPQGPNKNPQINAGKSERCISKKEGKKGNGKFKKYNIEARAEKMPSIAMFLEVKKFFIIAYSYLIYLLKHYIYIAK